MKKIILAALAIIVSGSTFAQEKAPEKQFTVVKENPITSIKNQNRSGTCWNYSSLSYFEAELLRQGKGEYDLCESFVCQKTYADRADKAVRMHGDVTLEQGGSFYDVLYCLKNYGICPQEAMPFPGSLYGDSLYNFNEMWPIAQGLVQTISKSKNKKIPLSWKSTFSEIMDGYFGKVPTTFEYKGKTYTPQTFAQSLGLNYDDYVSLTS